MIRAFDFEDLFIDELGWNLPVESEISTELEGMRFFLKPVAEKAGVVVWICTSDRDDVPYFARRKLQQYLAKLKFESLIIFVDSHKEQQVWHWLKHRFGEPDIVREQRYSSGMSAVALAQKVSNLAFSISDEERGVYLTDVKNRLESFNVDRITQKFYSIFQEEHEQLQKGIRGVKAADRAVYASVMLNRLMFTYFIQRKGFLDGDTEYLQRKLQRIEAMPAGSFYSFYRGFLMRLFHEGFGTRGHSAGLLDLLGTIPYLNGGLFTVHDIEIRNPELDIPNSQFARIFAFFSRFQWHLDDRALQNDNEINPDVLGYIFERYVNQKELGAYYTKDDVTSYIARNTIVAYFMERAQLTLSSRSETSFSDLDEATKSGADLLRLYINSVEEITEASSLLRCFSILDQLSILDPTCGSGAFLLAACNVLESLYESCLTRAQAFLWDISGAQAYALSDETSEAFSVRLKDLAEHHSRRYYILKTIVTRNIFGVDILEEAVEICKLRLFLRLASEVHHYSDIEPLPDIDFNIVDGNALIGAVNREDEIDELDLMADAPRLTAANEQADERLQRFREIQRDPRAATVSLLAAKHDYADSLARLNTEFDLKVSRRYGVADDPLSRRFARWKEKYKPLHWYVRFFSIMKDGGFAIIIGNPPFVAYDSDVDYTLYGYKTIGVRNLYSYVVERSMTLLRESGRFGMIVPLSITFTSEAGELRGLLRSENRMLFLSSYNNIPDKLFTGSKTSTNTSKLNQQRVSIILSQKSKGGLQRLYSTPTLRWKPEERSILFSSLPYAELPPGQLGSGPFPKIGRNEELRFLEQWRSCTGQVLGSLLAGNGRFSLFVPQTAGYYISAYRRRMRASQETALHFREESEQQLAQVLLNSNVFFWLWGVFGDSFHVTRGLIENCPLIPYSSRVSEFSAALTAASKECTVYKGYRGKKVPNLNYNKRLELLRQIDRWIVSTIGSDVDPSLFLWSKSNSFKNLFIPRSEDSLGDEKKDAQSTIRLTV